MELVEGETLADATERGLLPLEKPSTSPTDRRCARGRARTRHHPPRSQARQHKSTATARQGLDFGLAKALTSDRPLDDLRLADDEPTGAHARHVILGTAAYMSPSRHVAKAVDERSESGRSAASCSKCSPAGRRFAGDTVTDLAQRRSEVDPPTRWLLPRSTPLGIRAHLKRCLRGTGAYGCAPSASLRHDLDAPASVAAGLPGRRPDKRDRPPLARRGFWPSPPPAAGCGHFFAPSVCPAVVSQLPRRAPRGTAWGVGVRPNISGHLPGWAAASFLECLPQRGTTAGCNHSTRWRRSRWRGRKVPFVPVLGADSRISGSSPPAS